MVNHDSPFTVNGLKQNFTGAKAIEAIAFIMNFRPVKKQWLDAGIGSSWYIGKEDEGIREDFTRGDNNDGITIIDTIENKYCFMNIDTYADPSESYYDAKALPQLKPVSAREYVAAYYGETIMTTNPYYFGDHDRSKVTKTPDEQQKFVDSAIKINKAAAKGFDKFEILTLAEIKTMFPKMKQLDKKKVTKVK